MTGAVTPKSGIEILVVEPSKEAVCELMSKGEAGAATALLAAGVATALLDAEKTTGGRLLTLLTLYAKVWLGKLKKTKDTKIDIKLRNWLKVLLRLVGNIK